MHERKREPSAPAAGDSRRLAVLWSTADPEAALNPCMMYTYWALKNKWFDEVRLIVWGPSSKLLAENEALQTRLKELADEGVILQACVQCSDAYGVSDALRNLGIEVKGMGAPLTELLQSGCKVLTF